MDNSLAGKGETRRKQRFVPWEPWKAAASPDKKGLPEPPPQLPPLIPYSRTSDQLCEEGTARTILRDGRKARLLAETSPSDPEQALQTEVSILRQELRAQTERATQLERLVSATLDDDLLCHVKALADDKRTLASAIDKYSKELARKARLLAETSPSDPEQALQTEVSILRQELRAQTERATQLERLVSATLDDDLLCHVKALADDKRTLASAIDKYSKELARDEDEVEELRLEKEVLGTKLIAMAVRVDEEGVRAERALAVARSAQRILAEAAPLLPPALRDRALDISSRSLSPLFGRSPCDERVLRRVANFSNLTIGCCKRCAGREIYLL